MAMMLPSPSSIAEAYQRPCDMLCDCTNFPLAQSKKEARASPLKE
jgi:hypothetical protein